MSPPIASLFKVGTDILNAVRDATGFILLQLGDVIAEQAESQEAELWGPFGLCSIPAPATPGKSAAQGIAITRSDRDLCIAGRDSRCASIYGQLSPGETCVYASLGQARTLYKKDGSITHVTTDDNTSSGKTVAERLGPDGWRVTTPKATLIANDDGILFTTQSGKAWIHLQDDGTVTIAGTTINLMGGQVQLGANASALTPALTSAVPVVGVTGTGVPSTTVFLAP